jgi:NADH:ubiquinone oxidoreductase subunit 6 (subunit J)
MTEMTPLFWRIVLCVAVGMTTIYLLLPRPRPFPRLWGGVAGGVALLLTGSLLIRTAVSVESVLFYTFSCIAVIAGALLITQTNPGRAALSFALVVLSTCGLFLLQAAPFLMAATTIVYAGAIIVTFLFVLMLAHQEGPSDADWRSREPALACAAGFVLLGALLYVLLATYGHPRTLTVLKKLDDLLEPAVRAVNTHPVEQIAREPSVDRLFQEMRQVVREVPGEPRFARLHRTVEDHDNRFNDLAPGMSPGEFLKNSVLHLREEVDEARRTLGDLEPAVHPKQPLSPHGGPALAGKHDPQGNAPLPAENVAHLGRLLFTDYLLAVELGGTLLLVATIGAIVIASRREELKG